MARHVIGSAAEIVPGGRKIVEGEGISIGVFNVRGTFYALRNRCPHQGAPLCLGSVKGTTLPSAPGEYLWGREGDILRCPWHGWEFDILTGRSVFNPHRVRVKVYEVRVEPPEEPGGSEEREQDEPAAAAEASVETYAVAVEAGDVVLYLNGKGTTAR